MFLDTFGLLCILHRREPHHIQARSLLNSAAVRLTHSYVLAEFVALAETRGVPRNENLLFVHDMILNPDIETIWVDEPTYEEALQLLLARLDKTYSLCDAVSFVLMRRRGIVAALTNDHHFEQEGFLRLLK